MNIEQLKKKLESEREASSTKYGTKTEYSYKNTKLVSTQEIIDYDMVLSFQAGHEAATNRLLPLLEKAIEVAEFYSTEENLVGSIAGPNGPWDYSKVDLDRGKKAREALKTANEIMEGE